MAEFCLATGFAPSEYKALTLTEMKAFAEVWERMNKR